MSGGLWRRERAGHSGQKGGGGRVVVVVVGIEGWGVGVPARGTAWGA